MREQTTNKALSEQDKQAQPMSGYFMVPVTFCWLGRGEQV